MEASKILIPLPKELTPNPSRLLINLLSNPPMHIYSWMKIIPPNTTSIRPTRRNITRTIPLPDFRRIIQSFIEDGRRINKERFHARMGELPALVRES
jgi:hypothetical protein